MEPLPGSSYRAAARGDREALNALFERQLPGLVAYVRMRAGAELRERESSLDIAQSACREVLQDLPQHDPGDEEAFRRWLFTAAERKILDRLRFHRREKREAAREERFAPAESEAEYQHLRRAYAGLASPSEALTIQDEVRAVEAALGELPEDAREVILLAHVVGLPHAAIAERLGRSEGATRVLLHRSLARLSALLGAADH